MRPTPSPTPRFQARSVSLITRAPDPAALVGLVHSLTPKPADDARVWYRRPALLAAAVLAVTVGLNVYFW